MTQTRTFKKDDGREIPVCDDFLLPFLSPTSPGTRYWEPPPTGPITERQRGRAILQLHQVLHYFNSCGVDFRGKKFLDIGTGAGMLPRMMLHFTDIDVAVGADPYRLGEHKAGTHTTDEDEACADMVAMIRGESPGVLAYENYRHLVGYEHHSLMPEAFPYQEHPGKPYRFEQIGAHDLDQLNESFDLVYVKAIDHIPDWDGIFRAVAAATAPGAIFLIKHFSFFSFLGPHRYATTNIPWGHLLLSDDEYRRFAHEHHPHRAEEMINFYFTGLSYPRTPMGGLVQLAVKNGFLPRAIVNEPLRNIAEIHPLTEVVPDFWPMIRENWPQLSPEEMFSGRYHVVLKRV